MSKFKLEIVQYFVDKSLASNFSKQKKITLENWLGFETLQTYQLLMLRESVCIQNVDRVPENN